MSGLKKLVKGFRLLLHEQHWLLLLLALLLGRMRLMLLWPLAKWPVVAPCHGLHSD